MAKYDGLIIPRSYSEYINKTDAATHQQAHQVSGVLDDTPTENSPKAVKSGGVFTALADKQPTLTFDNVPTDNSDNPVKSNGIYDALAGKQDTLTFDDTPTVNSNNPVKSGGVYNAIANLVANNFSSDFTLTTSNKTATCTGFMYVIVIKTNSGRSIIVEDNDPILATDMYFNGDVYVVCFSFFVRKGHSYRLGGADTGAYIDIQHFLKISD